MGRERPPPKRGPEGRMKALTLTCPWAHAVAHWGKTIENRTWRPPRELFGQRFAIHAGKSPFRVKADGGATASDETIEELLLTLAGIKIARFHDNPAAAIEPVTPRWLHDRSSAILCVATVAGWVHEDGGYDLTGGLPLRGDGIESPWFVGPYGWVLTDVVTLTTPVPCKGAQGLWALPPDVEAAVMGQADAR